MPIPSPRWHLLAALFLGAALALAPALAAARAGHSFSGGGSFHSYSGMGSRGARSFEHNGAGPLTRSVTPAPGLAAHAPGYGSGSFFHRHPFLTGIMGGFLGSWLFHHFGIGMGIGALFQILILGFLIFLVARWVMRRGLASGAGGPLPRSAGAAAAPQALYRGTDMGVADGDLDAFQRLHAAIQEAWSRGDLGAMRSLMTPEMLGYFSEELNKNASQGVQNIVNDVRLLKGEVSEAWDEGDLQYATAYMRWSAHDYVVGLGGAPGDARALVSGDPQMLVESEEVWTFVRRRGGHWLLSAIQQV